MQAKRVKIIKVLIKGRKKDVVKKNSNQEPQLIRWLSFPISLSKNNSKDLLV